MNWVFSFAFAGLIVAIFWELDRIGNRISDKLESIVERKFAQRDDDLSEIKDKLNSIKDELKLFEKNISDSEILQKLNDIEATLNVMSASE